MTVLATTFVRYAAVGGAATVGHWLLMVLLVEAAAVPPWLASGLGATFGAQLAFVGNRRFTFLPGAAAPAAALWPSWWKFMATAAIGALFGMVVVVAGVALGAHYLLAQAVATGCSLLLTFAINRQWTFAG